MVSNVISTDESASNGLPAATNPAIIASPPSYFGEALKDAERLLKFASESGVSVEDSTRDHVLQARTAFHKGWDETTAANLLSALSKLAAQLKPVTAASLKVCDSEAGVRPTVHTYWIVASVLAVVILVFSVLSFVATAISTAIRADIATANGYAVKLNSELVSPDSPATSATSAAGVMRGGSPAESPTGLAPPAPSLDGQANGCGSEEPPSPQPASGVPAGMNKTDVISDLQQFAADIRSIDARARQLNVLVMHGERDPFAKIRPCPGDLHRRFELPTPLTNFTQATVDRTITYQQVRYFAQNLIDDVSFFYGAISACILPVLYALLGTCAYLLRSFEREMGNRTFVPSDANTARFLIAAIGGAVVGLFNNFTFSQGVSIPPLALAFLVGYGVDLFFTFLEGILQSFTKNAPGAQPPAPSPSAKA
jgi:hypothetical protein